MKVIGAPYRTFFPTSPSTLVSLCIGCLGPSSIMQGTTAFNSGVSGTERKGPRVLLVGYNGANNTGAEAKLLATIDDLRRTIPHAFLTVPSLDVDRLGRYLQEAPDLRIVTVPTLYKRKIRRRVKESDLVLLVEGSAISRPTHRPPGRLPLRHLMRPPAREDMHRICCGRRAGLTCHRR